MHNNKVFNIKSEILCREAEDDFFYFNKVNTAYKKLVEAVDLTPSHLKSIILLADISFMKGLTKKALELYKRAENIISNNSKILASIANCNYVLNNFDEALTYCEKAFQYLNVENYSLSSQIFEIKINILMDRKLYKKAYLEIVRAQNVINNTSFKTIYNVNYELLNEKLNIQKRLHETKLKIV